MKQIILHTARWISALALTTSPLAAAILTVDNKPGSVAMFNNLQDAYNAAQQDDAIVLAASPTDYGALTVYKRLHFRGPGYLLSQNGIPGTELAGNTATASMSFSSFDTLGTSTGSTVSGITISGGVQGVAISFDKCQINLQVGRDASVSVSRSYGSLGAGGGGSGSSVGSISVLVRDSIITSTVNFPYPGGGFGSIPLINLDRCVITAHISNLNVASTVSNSIIVTSGLNAATFADTYKGNISHCMAVGSSFLPVGNNNINGANLQDVFLAAGSDDARWQLKPASPARGAGLDGVDLGAFGGVQPYILSGLPSKPRLTRFIAPAVATEASGLRIELEAKSY